MKHVLIIMVACVLILSAFGLTIPKYGLYYEVAVEKIFNNVSGLIDAGSFIFQGSDGLLNSLFDITQPPEIELYSDSLLRLLTFEDYYMVEVVPDEITEVPDAGSATDDKMLNILRSNIPDFYYAKKTWTGDIYKAFDYKDDIIYTVNNTSIVFSELYKYSDFKTFLQDNHPSIANEIIEDMEDVFFDSSHAGGR